MANVFDQFDAAPSQAAPPPSGNVFDQFDAPAAPTRSGGARAPSDVANPFNQAGASASFDQRFNAGPMASATDISSGLGEGLRRKADEMLVGAPNAENIAAAGTLRALNTAGLNIPRALGSALQSLPVIGNGQSYGQNYEAAKEREEAYARQAPYAAGLGTATGIVGGALALPSLQAAKGAGLAGRMAANAATGAGYAAAGELIDNQDLGKAATAAAIGGAAGGLLTPVAEQAIKGAQALARSPMFARGAQLQNEAGELTTTAKAVLRKEGIDPDQITGDGQAMMALAFSRKGETPAAMREAVAGEFGIPLSRGQATGDEAALGLEAAALAGDRGSKAQGVGRDFTTRQQSAIDAARQDIGERVGRGVQIENPTQAAEVIADQAREYGTRASRGAEAAEQEANEILSRLRGPNPIDQVDAGARVGQGFVEEAGASRARYKAAYDDLAAMPGEFSPKVFDGLGTRVADSLGTDVPLDPVLTPAANRAMADLNNAASILGLRDGAGATAQQVEQLRKRFGAYYPATAQNPTDRMALGRIRSAFDDQMRGAAETGQFGPRSTPQAPAAAAVDDFPGFGLAGLPDPAAAIPGGIERAGAPRQAEPESLAAWAGKVGLPRDAETLSADLHRVPVAGYGTLARKNAPTWDQLRVKATEAGFFPPDETGAASAASIKDKILNAVQDERINGRKVFRLEDEAGAGSRKALGRVADENADNAAQVDWQARSIALEMERFGYRPQDLDRVALNDAAERMVRGEVDDAATAYERAVAGRAEMGVPSRGSASVADDAPFPELGEGFTPVPAGSALPVATPEGRMYAEGAARGRSLFRDHQTKFAPQGPGDDVGRFIRSVVDWGSEPVEISRKLYSGNPGFNLRIADRVKTTFGENSGAWDALRQGFISSVVTGRDMTPKAISERIGAALTGEKRALAYKVLSDEQVRGLRDFQTAVRTGRDAREAVPDWITTLGRSDFDPNRITGDLFGAGIPGSRPGSANYAGALKRFVGEDSAEWNGLRQAAWRRLVETSDGSAGLAPRAMAQRIREFTDGKGSGLARKMFSPEELAEFRRFGAAVQATVAPDGALRPNGGGKAGQIAGKALDGIAAALGFQAGGLPAAGAIYTGRFGTRLLQDGFAARAARQSFEGGAPRLAPPGAVLNLHPVGAGAGLATAYGMR